MPFSKHLKTYFFGCITWIIPMFASFFLYNPQTREFLPNFFGFKIIMFVLLTAVTTAVMKKLLAKKQEKRFISANTFLFVNIVLDAIVLIGLFNTEFTLWCATILPVYVVVFYSTEFVLQRNKK
jgi:hypothetical protein